MRTICTLQLSGRTVRDGDRLGKNRVLTVGLLAGLCGGAAEVLWVALYSGATHTDGMAVAQQVTASVIPAAAFLTLAPLLGFVIHMLLSVALGIAFAWAVWRFLLPYFGAEAIVPVAVVTLVLVWATNFFVVLPVLDPAFVTLMPYGVTLFSKVLFGITMGWVVQETAQPQPSRSL